MPLFHTLTCQERCPPSYVPALTAVHGVGAPLHQAQRTICDLQLRLNLAHAKSAHRQPEMNIARTGWGWGGCNPGPWRPNGLGRNWGVCGWTSADSGGSCWRHRASSLLPLPFLAPSTPPKLCVGLPFPGPSRGEWTRSLVML